jgi:hypothetical protein
VLGSRLVGVHTEHCEVVAAGHCHHVGRGL